MPKKANIYTIFVASPSDLIEERIAIPEIVNDWNAANGLPNDVIFLPIKWETHATPQLGGRPQEIINKQLVRDCDLLVALFWTRIGQSTGKEDSGTIEEIKEFVKNGKPALLYFSERPINPSKIDIDQLNRLNKFKDEIKSEGLIESFTDLYDFKSKFSRQLGITISRIVSEDGSGATISRVRAERIKRSTSHEVGEVNINEWLDRTYHAAMKEDGTVNLSTFAEFLARYTPVDYKSLGFQKLKHFLESRNMFEFEQISPTHQLIRRRSS